MSAMSDFDIEVQEAIADACDEVGAFRWYYRSGVDCYGEVYADADLCWFHPGRTACQMTLAAVVDGQLIDTGESACLATVYRTTVPGRIMADGDVVMLDGEPCWNLRDVLEAFA